MSNNDTTLSLYDDTKEGMLQNPSPLAVRAHREIFPRIKDTDIEEGILQMQNIIGASYLYAGRRVDKEQMEFTAKTLLAELMADDFCKGTKDLAWIDIQRGIRRGILGAGKEMYGISVSTLYDAILDYMDEVIIPAKNKLKKIKERANKQGVSEETMINAYASMMARANEEREKSNF